MAVITKHLGKLLKPISPEWTEYLLSTNKITSYSGHDLSDSQRCIIAEGLQCSNYFMINDPTFCETCWQSGIKLFLYANTLKFSKYLGMWIRHYNEYHKWGNK